MTQSDGRVRQNLEALSQEIDLCLRGYFYSEDIPSCLGQAMRYSLNSGGKRIRPVLCLSFAELFGLPREQAMPFACALECIHTYSLIHDDLPAMDDDDLHRGRPSNHKVFGEAIAILAGDSLLTESLVLMASMNNVPAEWLLAAIVQVAAAAGATGMGGGQALDITFEGRSDISLEQVLNMQAKKTGELLKASCLSGAILAGVQGKELEWVEDYGRNLGTAFQIADDIMDEIGDEKIIGKPVGSDRRQGKNTVPLLLGLERSRELAHDHVAKALRALALCRKEKNGTLNFLGDLAIYVVERAC